MDPEDCEKKVEHDKKKDHKCTPYKLRKMPMCTFFEQMKGLFVPNDCRTQVYYLIKFRYWRYIIFKADKNDNYSI
jgi:hypothetical protein